MWREAHARLGAVIHQHLALEKFGANLLWVGHVNRHGAAAALGIAWRVYPPAVAVGHRDEQRGLPLRLFADLFDTSFGNDFQSRLRNFQSGNVWRALGEPIDGWRITRCANLDPKGFSVAFPSSECRLNLLRQRGPPIKIPRARPATQPLQH